MLALPLLLAAAPVDWSVRPVVPGACAEPAARNDGRPGCYLAREMQLDGPPPELWWHIHEFGSIVAAEAKAHRWAATTAAHGRFWLYVLAGRELPLRNGKRRAVVGPLTVPDGKTVIARFIQADFPPGMRTSVHRHPGLEAFYVVAGEQCMEHPEGRRKLRAGDIFIVPVGPHVQAAPKGRKNLALILHRPGEQWNIPVSDWTPSQFCAD